MQATKNAVRSGRKLVTKSAVKRGLAASGLPLLAIAAAFITGTGAGLLSDNVRHTIDDFTGTKKETVGSRPAFVNRAIASDASFQQPLFQQASMPAQPQAAWFPANNQVEWKVAMQAGDTPASLELQNASSDHNRILRFFLASGNPSQPWMPAADLYVQAGRTVQIHLPRGRYLMQSVMSPISMPFDRAARIEPSNLAQLDMLQPDQSRHANLRLIVHPDNRVSSFRLDTLQPVQHANPVASPIANGPTLAAAPRNAIDDVRQMAARYNGKPIGTSYDRLSPAEDRGEYASLISAAITQ